MMKVPCSGKKTHRMTNRYVAAVALAFCIVFLSACGLAYRVEQLGDNVVTLATAGKRTSMFDKKDYAKDYAHVFEEGTAEDIQRFLDKNKGKGEGINVASHEGVTHLMWVAAKNPHPESVKTMLAAGANVNSLTVNRRSAIFFAAQYNPNPEIAKVLLGASAKLESEDADGATPLMASLRNPNVEVLRFLIASGSNTKHRSERGFTPLMVACRYSKPEFVELLLEAGSDVNAVNVMGITALAFAAAESPHPEIIDMLMQAGADARIVDINGHTALSAASNRPGIKEALIKAGAR